VGLKMAQEQWNIDRFFATVDHQSSQTSHNVLFRMIGNFFQTIVSIKYSRYLNFTARRMAQKREKRMQILGQCFNMLLDPTKPPFSFNATPFIWVFAILFIYILVVLIVGTNWDVGVFQNNVVSD
jgi:hypothetical protein